MRSSFAGIILAIAYVCATLTIGCFLLDRAAFNPDRSADCAGAILASAPLKMQLVNFLVDNTAAAVTTTPQEIEELRVTLYQVAEHPDGQRLMSGILRDAHAHLIGEMDEPVTLTGQELVPIVRHQGAAAIEQIIMPVPRVTVLVIVDRVLGWLVPICGLLTLVLLALGLFLHRDRAGLVRIAAAALGLLAILNFIIGYVVPKWVVPLADSSRWADVPSTLADQGVPLLIAIDLLLIGAAVALIVGSGSIRRRRRWSQPISRYRYTDDRRWG